MQVETIYRAKKIDSDEWVQGDLVNVLSNVGGKVHKCIANAENLVKSDRLQVRGYYGSSVDINKVFLTMVDPSTLAIHFTNSGMNDSEGTPIFASLSSDGNGGDRLLLKDLDKGFSNFDENNPDETRVVILKDFTVCVENIKGGSYCNFEMIEQSLCKITGIHTI